MNTIYVVMGPTASGKSAWAFRRCLKQGGSIVNADSQQIYEGLPLLTDQPDFIACQQVSHKLYGTVSYDQPITAWDWSQMAEEVFVENQKQKILSFVVGGTGFYINALTKGLSPIPSVPVSFQQEWDEHFLEAKSQELWAILTEKDPHHGIGKEDAQRLRRALMVEAFTGKPWSWWASLPPRKSPWSFRGILFLPEAEVTCSLIRGRFEALMEQEALFEEVENFTLRPFWKQSPLQKALGFQEIRSYMQGHITRQMCIDAYTTKVKQYAKRQRTWFRHQLTHFEFLKIYHGSGHAEFEE